MPSIATLCSSLAAFGATVAGVKNSYDLNAIPDKVTPAQLPALCVVLPSQQVSPYQTLAEMGSAPKLTLRLEHWLLADLNVKEAKRTEPGRAALLDAYLAAAAAQQFLTVQSNPIKQAAMQFDLHITPVAWGDVVFDGVIFRYSLELYY